MQFCIWTVPRMRGNLASFSVPFSSLSSWPAGPMSPANVMLLTLFDWIMKKMTFLKVFSCNGVLIYAQFGFSTWRAQLWVLALTVYDASFPESNFPFHVTGKESWEGRNAFPFSGKGCLQSRQGFDCRHAKASGKAWTLFRRERKQH